MSVETVADDLADSDAIEELRECEDALEFLAEGDYPASEFAEKLLDGLAEVDD